MSWYDTEEPRRCAGAGPATWMGFSWALKSGRDLKDRDIGTYGAVLCGENRLAEDTDRWMRFIVICQLDVKQTLRFFINAWPAGEQPPCGWEARSGRLQEAPEKYLLWISLGVQECVAQYRKMRLLTEDLAPGSVVGER